MPIDKLPRTPEQLLNLKPGAASLHRHGRAELHGEVGDDELVRGLPRLELD